MGPMVYGDSDDEVFLGNSITTKKNYSEEIAFEIDKEVRSIVENAYAECKQILNKNMDKLHYVAKGLLLYETLDSEQFMQAFNEELSLDENDVFAKKEESKVILDQEEDTQEESNEEEKANLRKSKLEEFKLPEDDNE
ncbi:ATP-dependent zinc metalloprotease FtsH [bioreactor metagenome]|uniref:ATP-dependent zinc metalloprotease FtsH n=1 Tax=bioreactor metagenome TaxID=1076179 RepID=A0A645DKE1_9ZZZZ